MSYPDEINYPPCASCGGDVVYDIHMEATDGESIDQGCTLTIKAVCGDCSELQTPTPRMRQDMMVIAARLTPEDAVVEPAGASETPTP
ncbi:MAG: hypothetical protein OXF79_22465 [Chloroflexi bacterium]|nr:hypothetical protein [Chloroflexota bacterium]